MKKKHHVLAVLDNDLIGVLHNLGLIDLLRNGELHCFICGDIVNEESLQAIIPYGKSFSVLCSKSICLKKIAQKGE